MNKGATDLGGAGNISGGRSKDGMVSSSVMNQDFA